MKKKPCEFIREINDLVYMTISQTTAIKLPIIGFIILIALGLGYLLLIKLLLEETTFKSQVSQFDSVD